MEAAEEIKKLTQQTDAEAKADAADFVKTLSDVQPFYSGTKGDYVSSEELETMVSDTLGKLPDYVRPEMNVSNEDREAARNWAQSLPD